MTRDEAVALIKGRMGRNANSSLDAIIVSEMQFVQENILEGGAVMPWFLESQSDALVTVADTRTVAMPSDFIRERDEGAFWRFGTAGDDTTLVELFKSDSSDLQDIYASADNSGPTHYSMLGTSVELYPKPDAVYSLRLNYYATATVLSSNVENAWLKYASDWVIAETGYIIANEHMQSDKMAAKFLSQIQAARARILQRDTAIKEANRDRFKGDY